MLTSLEIENFKGIAARQRIEFAPLTLLFGANSAAPPPGRGQSHSAAVRAGGTRTDCGAGPRRLLRPLVAPFSRAPGESGGPPNPGPWPGLSPCAPLGLGIGQAP